MAHIDALNTPITVVTPTGNDYAGVTYDPHSIVAVSIIRAGDSMLDSFLSVVPEASVGKILIQRDEETKEPVLYYSKLPPLESKHVILLDPMLATGGSAKAAVKVLIDKGVPEERITFFNVLCCPEGVQAMFAAYPRVKIITGAIDSGLNEKVRMETLSAAVWFCSLFGLFSIYS